MSLKLEPRDLDEAIESFVVEEIRLRLQVEQLQSQNADLIAANSQLQRQVQLIFSENVSLKKLLSRAPSFTGEKNLSSPDDLSSSSGVPPSLLPTWRRGFV